MAVVKMSAVLSIYHWIEKNKAKNDDKIDDQWRDLVLRITNARNKRCNNGHQRRRSKPQAWTLQMFQRLHDFRQIKRRYSCLAVLVHFNVTRRKIEILVGLRAVSGSERYWLRCLLIMDWLMWECCDCTAHWKHSIARAHTYTHRVRKKMTEICALTILRSVEITVSANNGDNVCQYSSHSCCCYWSSSSSSLCLHCWRSETTEWYINSLKLFLSHVLRQSLAGPVFHIVAQSSLGLTLILCHPIDLQKCVYRGSVLWSCSWSTAVSAFWQRILCVRRSRSVQNALILWSFQLIRSSISNAFNPSMALVHCRTMRLATLGSSVTWASFACQECDPSIWLWVITVLILRLL